ncbi:hypothetical protein ACVNPS_08895 [Candidatus Bipolaricaulota sp. J31]
MMSMRGLMGSLPLGIGLSVWAQEATGGDAGGVSWWVWLIVALILVGAAYYAFKRRGRKGEGK